MINNYNYKNTSVYINHIDPGSKMSLCAVIGAGGLTGQKCVEELLD